MDGHSIIVKVLINGVILKFILINTGCKYYSMVDKDFIIKLQFPRVKIPLKSITGFVKENIKKPAVEITKIVKCFINI